MTTVNNNTNSVLSVLAQATNNDGSRKAGVWPTKGYDMLSDSTINAEINAQGAVINGKEVSTAVLTAKALQPVFEGGETLAQWLAYTSNGFISYQQQRAATGIVPTGSKVTAKTVDIDLLTAEELEAYYMEQLKPAKPDLLAWLTSINNDSISIDARIEGATELLAMLKGYKKELSATRSLSPEQQAIIDNKRQAEARFNVLYDAGLKGLTRTKAGYSASCNMESLAAVMGILLNDYVVIGQPVYSIANSNMLISFKDKA